MQTTHGPTPLQQQLQQSQAEKELGNECFRRQGQAEAAGRGSGLEDSTCTPPETDYETAIEHYSEAIELCPPADTAAAAPYYCNRAACYMKLVRRR